MATHSPIFENFAHITNLADRIFEVLEEKNFDSQFNMGEAISSRYPEFTAAEINRKIPALRSEWMNQSPVESGYLLPAQYIAVKLVEQLAAAEEKAAKKAAKEAETVVL